MLMALPLLVFTSSCSHKFAKLEASKDVQIVEQILKVKIFREGDLDRLTVYTQVDRQNKRAILDGIGKFDKYVFHMEVNGNRYYFIDHINGKTEEGTLSEFDLMELSPEDIFGRIDISRPQPIKLEGADKGSVRLEITVEEQKQASAE